MDRRYFLTQATGLVAILGLSWALTASAETSWIGNASAAVEKVNLAIGYKVDPDWPRKPAKFEWGDVPGVAVDAEDNVWMFNRGNVAVQVYRTDGSLLRSWDHLSFKKAHHITIGPQGNVWVADEASQVVQKYTPEGKLLLTLGTAGETGEDAKHFNRPTDVAISQEGDVFVSDGYGNSRIVHFDSEGNFIKTWGKLGTAPGEFDVPHSIVFDSRNRLYVADRSNARVQVFETSGRFLAEWRNLLVPWGIWITKSDEIYVCGSSPMRWASQGRLGTPPKDQILLKFSSSGRVLEHWTFPLGELGKEQPGELNWVHAVAVDSRGQVYLGDIKGQRVQRMLRLN